MPASVHGVWLVTAAGDENNSRQVRERLGLSSLGNYLKVARERARRIGGVPAQFGRWLHPHALGKPRGCRLFLRCAKMHVLLLHTAGNGKCCYPNLILMTKKKAGDDDEASNIVPLPWK